MSDAREPDELIVGNWFGVAAKGELVTILGALSSLSREEALNLAAYLAVTADPLGIQFDSILTQLRAEKKAKA